MKNFPSCISTEALNLPRVLTKEQAEKIISAAFEGCENVFTFDHVPAEKKARLDAADQFVLLLTEALVTYYNNRSPNAFKNDVSPLDLPSIRFGTFSNIPFLKITVGPLNSMRTTNHVPISLEIHGHVQCRGLEAFTHRFDLTVNAKKGFVCIRNNPKTPKPIKIVPAMPEKEEITTSTQNVNNSGIASDAPRTNEEFAEIIRAIYVATTHCNSFKKVVSAILKAPDIRSHFKKNGNLGSFLEINNIGNRTVALLESLCSKGIIATLSVDNRDEVLMALRNGGKFPECMIS